MESRDELLDTNLMDEYAGYWAIHDLLLD
jgi:hypothetical protein